MAVSGVLFWGMFRSWAWDNFTDIEWIETDNDSNRV